MVHLSVLSFTAALLYLYTGFKSMIQNRKSTLCRLFFYITLSMAIWSFAGGFLYLAENPYQYAFWNKIAAIGWCSFEALTLYLTLVLTGNRNIRHWYIKLMVLLPAPVFLFMVLFLFGPDIDTSPVIESIFYTGNFLYNLSYLAISMVLIFLWGHRSQKKLEKKQANIVVICSLIPFILNLMVDKILPSLGVSRIPNMGQIFTLIMLLGVDYAIINYQFMSTSSTEVTKNLFNELTGLKILTDSGGCVVKVNKYAYELLGYSQDEMIGTMVTSFIQDQSFCKTIAECENIIDLQKFSEIDIIVKSGSVIPFDLSIVPIYIKGVYLQGFLIIGEDIRTNKSLQNVIAEHSITIERLYNSEKIFRTLLEITPVAILLISRNTRLIRYLNRRAEELLAAERDSLIGSKVTEYFVNQDDIDLFVAESQDPIHKISMIESLFKRFDGSRFNGLVTMDYAIYNDEEVVFACVIDMTVQKKTEEILKLNNEKIIKLNDELTIMNHILANKSAKDGLTNLYNHQYMNEILETRLEEIGRNEDLCLMMLDIDHFKQVNDKYGHQIGDQVLITLAEVLMDNLGTEDSIGRYGGEEFIAILPNVKIDQAFKTADNIRKKIEAYNFVIKDLKITISIGVVQYKGEISQALINKADMLLYKAKNNGRNRVEV